MVKTSDEKQETVDLGYNGMDHFLPETCSANSSLLLQSKESVPPEALASASLRVSGLVSCSPRSLTNREISC